MKSGLLPGLAGRALLAVLLLLLFTVVVVQISVSANVWNSLMFNPPKSGTVGTGFGFIDLTPTPDGFKRQQCSLIYLHLSLATLIIYTFSLGAVFVGAMQLIHWDRRWTSAALTSFWLILPPQILLLGFGSKAINSCPVSGNINTVSAFNIFVPFFTFLYILLSHLSKTGRGDRFEEGEYEEEPVKRAGAPAGATPAATATQRV